MIQIRVIRPDKPATWIQLPAVPAAGDQLWMLVPADDGGTFFQSFVVVRRVWRPGVDAPNVELVVA